MALTTTGSRIPLDYFIFRGAGQAPRGSGEALHFETGAYDSALLDAGIANQNIVKYSSIVPPQAKQISATKGRKSLTWGCVAECIMAQMNGNKGETVTAGLLITEIYKNGVYQGSFADEYAGQGTTAQAKEALLYDVIGMVERRGFGKITASEMQRVKKHGTDIIDKKIPLKTNAGHTFKTRHIILRSLKIKQQFGTVMAGICFTRFMWPK